MSASPRTPREEFARLIDSPADHFNLAWGSLLIARDEFPTLRIDPYLDQIAELGRRVTQRIGTSRDPLALLAALNNVLFEEEGFKGNSDTYYDPRNSFLNEVIDRRLGIPITLSILYMEVGRHAGIPLAGIGLPGHFIVGLPSPGRTIYVDPFHAGQTLTVQDCAERVAKIFDGKIPLSPQNLLPVRPRDILFRLLTNLKNIYRESRSFAKSHAVIDKMTLLAPEDGSQVRDRGLVRYQLHHYPAALADLDTYLNETPEAPDRSDILNLKKLILKEMKQS